MTTTMTMTTPITTDNSHARTGQLVRMDHEPYRSFTKPEPAS
jgi:hypothetical protein